MIAWIEPFREYCLAQTGKLRQARLSTRLTYLQRNTQLLKTYNIKAFRVTTDLHCAAARSLNHRPQSDTHLQQRQIFRNNTSFLPPSTWQAIESASTCRGGTSRPTFKRPRMASRLRASQMYALVATTASSHSCALQMASNWRSQPWFQVCHFLVGVRTTSKAPPAVRSSQPACLRCLGRT